MKTELSIRQLEKKIHLQEAIIAQHKNAIKQHGNFLKKKLASPVVLASVALGSFLLSYFYGMKKNKKKNKLKTKWIAPVAIAPVAVKPRASAGHLTNILLTVLTFISTALNIQRNIQVYKINKTVMQKKSNASPKNIIHH